MKKHIQKGRITLTSFLGTSKSRLTIILLVGVALMVGLYFTLTYWRSRQNQNGLVLYGNVDIRQLDLGFRVSGRIAKVLFEEGDVIKPGDVVAVLDKGPYEASVAAAMAQLLQAKENFAKLKHGNRPQEIEEARATVTEQQAALENAESQFKRQSEEIKIGSTSQKAYDDALAQKIKANADLKSAQEALSLSLEGFRKEDIRAGQAAMETAKAQLESAKINLNDTEIISPSEGTILSRVREPGSIVSPGSVVYTLSLRNPIRVRAYVSEPDLGRIKPGMEALVITDTHPDKPFKGHIGFISPQAEFTPKTVQTPELRTDLVFMLFIVVEDPEGQLRQGMPVTVKIKLKK